MDGPHFVYPLIHQQTVGLSSSLGFCEKRCYERACKGLSEYLLSVLWQINLGVERGNGLFNILRTLQTVSHCSCTSVPSRR